MEQRTEFELPRPHRLWRVGHEPFGEVSLHATNHVVTARLAALTDDAKSVVFHDGCAADAPQKALLHPALKLEHSDLG